MLLQKDSEGHPLMHKLKEITPEGALDRSLSNAEIRARIQGLKGEVDELLRLLGGGDLEGSKMICCHKCGAGMSEYPAKEIQSNLFQTKDT